jgi:nitric oxide reductase subunit B
MAFYSTTTVWQWMRLPGDVVFALGALLMAGDFLAKLRPLLPRPADQPAGAVPVSKS